MVSAVTLAVVGYIVYPRHITAYAHEVSLTESQLRDQSDAIILGKISQPHSVFIVPGNDTTLMTEWNVQVEKMYKGTTAKKISVDVPGGTFGGLTVDYADVQKLTNGERVVMYLRWLPTQKKWVPMGLVRGLRHVQNSVVRDTVDQQDLSAYDQSFTQ